MHLDYLDYDAIGLANLIKNKEITSRDLLEIAISRTEAINAATNAIILKNYEYARKKSLYEKSIFNQQIEESNNFLGIPFLVDDIGATVANLPMSMGSKHYRHFIPDRDELIVTIFRKSGLNIFAKTNISELGQMPCTESELFGICRNPWNLDYTPGGSSGGAASAVASGIVPMAHSIDNNGTIRISASCCGLFGLKPSNIYQLSNNFPFNNIGINHVISRSVRDSAFLLDIILSNLNIRHKETKTFLSITNGVKHKSLRIALITNPMLANELSIDIFNALDDAAKLLESLGHYIEPVDLCINFKEISKIFLIMQSIIIKDYVFNAKKISGKNPGKKDFETITWMMAYIGKKLNKNYSQKIIDIKYKITNNINKLFTEYDIILCATLASAPIKIRQMQLTSIEKIKMHIAASMCLEGPIDKIIKIISNKIFSWSGCTELFNFTGHPAMSVPLYWNSKGLPIGVQFIAKISDEATLYSLAAQLENARPWFNKRPPLLHARDYKKK